jgi:hypothetical protein
MTPPQVMGLAASRGVKVFLGPDGGLKFGCRGPLPGDVRELLVSHKPALLEWLAAEDKDDPAERAALSMPEGAALALLPAAAGFEAAAGVSAPADDQDDEGDDEPGPVAAGGADTDELGIPLDEVRRAVFARLTDFREAALHGRRLAAVLDRIAKGPYGVPFGWRAGLERLESRGRVRYEAKELRQLLSRVKSLTPYAAACPRCLDRGTKPEPACRTCYGLGVVTKQDIDRLGRELAGMVLACIPDEAVRRDAAARLRKKWWT